MTTSDARRARFALATLLALSAAPATAGQLTVPNSFTAGTPAKAGEVNANFTAVKTAVDDNDGRLDVLEGQNLSSRLTTVEGQKQKRVDGTCAAGSSIRAVAADGTVTCEADDNTTYTATAPVTLTGNAFGLAAGGIADSHVSSSAAIAVAKISGDAGAEWNSAWWSLDAITTSYSSLGSIVVSAPGPGVVLLFMNGEAHNSGVNFLHVYAIGTSTTAPGVERTLTPMNNTQTYALSWAYPVSSAGNYTFHALAKKADPTGCCTAWTTGVNLIAIFVPKRY
jgi:hypothetical protein